MIPTSPKEIYWKCSACGTKWIAKVCVRTKGYLKCPTCNPPKRNARRNLKTLITPLVENPWVAKFWDYKKNDGIIDINKVSCDSHSFAWWICEKCDDSFFDRVRKIVRRKKTMYCPDCNKENIIKYTHLINCKEAKKNKGSAIA